MTITIIILLSGIGIGIFVASIFALWMLSRLLSKNSKEQDAAKAKNDLFTHRLISHWEVCNAQNRRQADALEKIAEHLNNVDLSQ